MEIYSKKIENFFPPQFNYLGYLLIALGLYLCYLLNPIGLFLICLGLFFRFLIGGIAVDFDDMAYRDYFGIFGFRFGKWKALPEIQYVTVFIERLSQNMNVESISGSNISINFKVDLIISRSHRINVDNLKKRGQALEQGKFFAHKLNVKLLDYTDTEAVWVEI